MFLISSASFASTLHRLYSVKIIIVIHFRGNLLFQDNVAALGFTPIFNILLKLFLYKDIFYFETIANTNFIVVEIISLGLVFEGNITFRNNRADSGNKLLSLLQII